MHVVLVAAMTANGLIARETHETANWTSKSDKKFFVAETKRHKVMIMGSTTYKTIGRPLAERLIIVLTRNPQQIEAVPGSVETAQGTPQEVIAALEARGFASVVIAGGANVYSEYLDSGCVNELALTIEPVLFTKGVNLANNLSKEVHLALLSVEKIGTDSILARYRIER